MLLITPKLGFLKLVAGYTRSHDIVQRSAASVGDKIHIAPGHDAH